MRISINSVPLFCLLLTVFLAGPLRAGTDERLKAGAEQALPDVLQTITRLVGIDSGSGNAKGLAALADVLDKELTSRGFATQRFASPVDVMADTLVGTRRGSGTQNVMLMIHMDTVYLPGILDTQPIRQDGNRLYGPGAADAKGGIALILHSIDLLDSVGWEDFDRLTVLFNPDEETGSAGSGALIARLASEHDTVLIFEPGGRKGIGDWLLLATAEYVQVTLEVTGRASHAGTAPERGANAAIELAHRILQTRDIAKEIPGAQLNWTNLLADQAYNQIPARAVALADVRITRDGATKALEAALRAALAQPPLVPGTQTTLTLQSLRPGYRGSDRSLEIAQMAQSIHREIAFNQFLLLSNIKGATDAGYAGMSGKAAVLEGFGPSGAGYHAADEYIEIDSIPRNLYVVARLLIELGLR
ncbi:glutamate carboxypeptidase [Antarctobacter jejuensis]|uniref:glutamate carboxypeptidase n=1 Tax=Antarctobacter jejuensis TaxID=1439938 RepID=UPI003FD081A6